MILLLIYGSINWEKYTLDKTLDVDSDVTNNLHIRYQWTILHVSYHKNMKLPFPYLFYKVMSHSYLKLPKLITIPEVAFCL